MPTHKAKLWVVVAIALGLSATLPSGGAAAASASHKKPMAYKKTAKAAPKTAAKPKITFSSPNDTVVAIVNGQKITKWELMQAVWERYAVQTLSELIDKTAIRQAAAKEGVTATKADLDAKVAEFKSKLPPGTNFQQFLQQYNLTEPELRKELEINVLVEKAAGKGIKVTDQDLASYIDARHILIETKGTTPEERAKSEAEGKAKIEQIASDIKSGKITFAQAAEKYSDDPGSKAKGGELGFFKRGTMVPEFDKAAFALTPGEISAPVKTSYGWHLIQVEKLGKDATGAEKADLIKRIRDERLRPEMSAWYMKVRQDAKVTQYLGSPPKPPVVAPAPRAQTRPQPSTNRPAVAPRTSPKPGANGSTNMKHDSPPPPPAPSH